MGPVTKPIPDRSAIGPSASVCNFPELLPACVSVTAKPSRDANACGARSETAAPLLLSSYRPLSPPRRARRLLFPITVEATAILLLRRLFGAAS